MYQWYLVQAKPGQAAKAQVQLENQGFDTYLPLINVMKTVRGKLTEKQEPLFPGYLFIYLSMQESNWRPIRSTLGVARVVSFGGEPAIVPSDAVMQIRNQLRGQATQAAFETSEPIDIIGGPLKGLKAIFDGYDGDQRAFLLLELLGKWQRISVEFDKLKKPAG